MKTGGSKAIDAVSGAPFGSASILLISWAYIKMLGGKGLSASSQMALLNANYIANRLHKHFNIRFKNDKGRVAHELLIDLAEFEKSAGLKVMDFAKRLQVRDVFSSFGQTSIYPTKGLWVSSPDMFVAHIDLHAYRTYGIRESRGIRPVSSIKLPFNELHPYISRFCDAMIQIRHEAQDIVDGRQPRENNVLKNAPHPMSVVIAEDKEWNRFVLLHFTNKY